MKKASPDAAGTATVSTTRTRRASTKPSDKTLHPRATEARRLSPEARRAQIIAVAEELFTTRPYHELGVPEVAKALRITPGLVYHYFPTKEALLVAAVELRARELLRSCLPDLTLPFVEQVERGLKGYFDYVEAHSLAYQNLLRGPTAAESEVLRICEAVRITIVDHFLAGAGLLHSELPATRLSLRAFMGYAEHAILQWLDHRELPRATIERMCIGMMLAALRSGLHGDPASPLSAQQLAELELTYARHFGLQTTR